MFGSWDLSGFPIDLLSDGDSVYTRENFNENVHTWKFLCKFGDSRKNMFDMYRDFRENLQEILAVVTIWSPISSVRGMILVIVFMIKSLTAK